MRPRKLWMISIFVPLLFAFMTFTSLEHEPRFAAIKNIDIVRMIAVGMCLGVALSGLFGLLRGSAQNR